MQDTWFHPDIVDRDFGSHLLHVPQFLEWMKSQNLVLPPLSRPIEDYRFVQVEMLLSAIANLHSITPEQALAVVMTIPELSAHRLHDVDADDEYIERVGVCVLRKNPPERDGTRIARWQPGERGDANFARWQLGGVAKAAWRKRIAAGILDKELVLFDFASKLPIAHSVAIACCDLVVEPGQVPTVQSKTETTKERRARWLTSLEKEKEFKERGALTRLHEQELLLNPKADRAYMGKEIKNAMRERQAATEIRPEAPAFTSRKIKGRYT